MGRFLLSLPPSLSISIRQPVFTQQLVGVPCAELEIPEADPAAAHGSPDALLCLCLHLRAECKAGVDQLCPVKSRCLLFQLCNLFAFPAYGVDEGGFILTQALSIPYINLRVFLDRILE